ncbi:hypothetical protein TNCV_479581 [Trichonephila clavipes]|nr:hypothetical protein TNCV_479581 [Trichonephila clavipes]
MLVPSKQGYQALPKGLRNAAVEKIPAELCPIPTLKTTCENCGRHKNVVREPINVEDMASAMKIIVNGGRREGAGAKNRATESVSKRNGSCICPIRSVIYSYENKGLE